MQMPCGGRGVCGKCRVILDGNASESNEAERRARSRLACQARLLGDCHAVLPLGDAMAQIEVDGIRFMPTENDVQEKAGAAVDIGTTTIALRLYDLHSGQAIGSSSALNPQTSVAADVMGRIGAALSGRLDELGSMASGAIKRLLHEACQGAQITEEDVTKLVVTGNTTMLYLLTGRSPHSLAKAPFDADDLFDREVSFLGLPCYLPPCMNAFVGADIACAVLAAGQCRSPQTSLLIDIGTNGEIALWKDGTLYVTSTAAGPAFEGAGISQGCGSMIGAIDRVWIEKGGIVAHTIGDAPAAGVCGSGLVDAVASLLKLGIVDETGATEEALLPIGGGVSLTPRDIRQVQLAKAAIAAGIYTLMEKAHVLPAEIAVMYIAGGFGSHLDVQSATAIGLIPAALADKAVVIGNAALSGASALLFGQSLRDEIKQIRRVSRHVNLGGNSRFNSAFVDEMLFPDSE